MSIMVVLIILAFSMEISQTLAPQYSTFGIQTFLIDSPQKGAPCNLSMITSSQMKVCIMSNLSKFYDRYSLISFYITYYYLCTILIQFRIAVSLPLFSLFFYMITWFLLIIIFFSILFSANKTNVDGDNNRSRSFDDDELNTFVED